MKEIIGRRVVGPIREGGEADHSIACGCGQQLDIRLLDQLLRHGLTCRSWQAGVNADKPSSGSGVRSHP